MKQILVYHINCNEISERNRESYCKKQKEILFEQLSEKLSETELQKIIVIAIPSDRTDLEALTNIEDIVDTAAFPTLFPTYPSFPTSYPSTFTTATSGTTIIF
jgi:hypothetical protein